MSISKNPDVARGERIFLYSGLAFMGLALIQKVSHVFILHPVVIFGTPLSMYLIFKSIDRREKTQKQR